MLHLISGISIAATMMAAQPMNICRSDCDCIGRLPEVVITAQRFESEDIAYCGMLSEIVVTAPRYEGEDIAYCGMMPEVLVTASRYEVSNLDLTLISILRHKLPLRIVYPELVLRANFRSTGYLN
ncbi:MAG: hypothetical protein WBB67_09375 [bacterium]